MVELVKFLKLYREKIVLPVKINLVYIKKSGEKRSSAYKEDEVSAAFYVGNVQIFFSLFSKREMQKGANDKVSNGNTVETTN